jgi:hypothetical protein
MNIFIITSTWKFNKNIRVMLSRKRRTLHLTGFAYISCFCIYMLIYCRQNKITQHQKRGTIFVLFSFSFVGLSCFSSVNIIKVKLVVTFCYLSVISDSCEPCLGVINIPYP